MNNYSGYDAEVFEQHVSKALASVRRVLDIERASGIGAAGDIDHAYNDKYKLADAVTNSAIVALMHALDHLGLTKESLGAIISVNKETTLRFTGSKTTTLVRLEEVDRPVMDIATKTATNSTNTKAARTTIVLEDDFAVVDDGSNNKTETTTEERTTSTVETIVRKIIRFHYDIVIEWELSVYSGTDVVHRTILRNRKCHTHKVHELPSSTRLATQEPLNCRPDKRDYGNTELSLGWLLRQIDVRKHTSHFSIDAFASKTPYRNKQVEQALSFFDKASRWACAVSRYLQEDYLHEGILRCTAGEIFVPVLPLMQDRNTNSNRKTAPMEIDDDNSSASLESWNDPETSESRSGFQGSSTTADGDDGAIHSEEGGPENHSTATSPMLSAADTARFLAELKRTLSEVDGKLKEKIPFRETTTSITGTGTHQDDEVFSLLEAKTCVLLFYAEQLASRHASSLRYIESMLKQQLIVAIGKEVDSSDLDKYVKYHNEKLLCPSPKRFCYTIRRPEHYPDGILSIEEAHHSNRRQRSYEPIATHVREIPSRSNNSDPIEVPLNAATTLTLTGKTYVHGWLNHRFGGTEVPPSVRLTARARQFSSFVLLVGTMTKRNRFEPRDAIILRNKDVVHIPLLLHEIPTATEFKHAVSSLSPEQQHFASSFRSMQLDSSVVGVCVVQIKPQLEKLLGLPPHALTKEMKLTEDLTELFVEYQIPSDLVSCDLDSGGAVVVDGGNHNNTAGGSTIVDRAWIKDRVDNVREHVESVLGVIAAQKQEQLEEQEKKATMAMAREVAEQKRRSEYIGGSFAGGSGDAAAAATAVHVMAELTGCSQLANRDGINLSAVPAPGNCYAYVNSNTKYPCRSKRAGRTNLKRSATSFSMIDSDSLEFTQGNEMVTEGCTKSEGKRIWKKSSTSSNPGDDEDTQKAPSSTNDGSSNKGRMDDSSMDFTAVPKILDKAIELHDATAAIRSTTIEASDRGRTRFSQKTLLSKGVTESLTKATIATETSRAFDLLDALSRSGSLSIDSSELHVIVCATHRFDKSVMDTVLQDNVNPIEQLEGSTLLMASTILGVPATALVRSGEARHRLEASFPRLLGRSLPPSVAGTDAHNNTNPNMCHL